VSADLAGIVQRINFSRPAGEVRAHVHTLDCRNRADGIQRCRPGLLPRDDGRDSFGGGWYAAPWAMAALICSNLKKPSAPMAKAATVSINIIRFTSVSPP